MSETLLDAPASTGSEGAGDQGTTPPPAADTPQGGDQGIVLPPAELDWTDALNPDGTFGPKAYENGLDEHWKSVGALQQSYKDLQRMKGAPGAEATPEEIDRFRQAQGVPAEGTAAAYGVELPEELQGAISQDGLDAVMAAANQSAHLGHTAMVSAMAAKFAEVQGQQLQADEQASAQQMEQRRQELMKDPAFAGTNQAAALQTSRNTLEHVAGALGVSSDSDEVRELASNPLAVRMLHYFGTKMGQDNTGGLVPQVDLRSGEEQAEDIISNPNNPDHKAYHEGDPVIGRKVLRLMGHRE